MYEKLYNNLDEFLSGHVATILKDITAVSKKDLLVEYENHWTHYNRIIVLLDGAFGHLNRQYVKNAVSRERIRAACYLDRINMDYTSDRAVWLSVSELALVHWRNVLMPTVKDDIIKTSLNLIGRDRQCGIGGGGDISKIREQANAVKCVCESLVNTQFCQVMLEDSSFNYNDSFEKPLLQLTCQFYQNIAKQTTLNDSYDALDYIVRVSELVEEERSRMEAFIYHIPQINKFLKIFLFDKDEDAITTYYKLFKEMDNLDELVKSFSEYVHCQLSSDQLPMTDPLTFVPTFLKIYRKLQNMVRSLMSSDIALIKALDESVFAVVNQKREHFNESPTLLLSLYMDSTLRNKHANCKDIKDALLIFKYINDKDVFYTFYLKHMILRLVYSQNSRDFGLEEDVLCKLKKVFVTDFISKPQHILTDYTLSNQLSKSFSLQYGRSFPYKFAVSVFRVRM
ncbi:hypothetical protein GJ496_001020 [Pomphorhynchus laevis]|nr:hypothetical protein GJ496_001020 [Pomphorhynchus laevis]